MLGKVAFINISVEDGVKAAIFTSGFLPGKINFSKGKQVVLVLFYFPPSNSNSFHQILLKWNGPPSKSSSTSSPKQIEDFPLLCSELPSVSPLSAYAIRGQRKKTAGSPTRTSRETPCIFTSPLNLTLHSSPSYLCEVHTSVVVHCAFLPNAPLIYKCPTHKLLPLTSEINSLTD